MNGLSQCQISNIKVMSHFISGISGKSQALFAMVFCTRYLDLFFSFISLYNTSMKIIYITCSVGRSILYIIACTVSVLCVYNECPVCVHWVYNECTMSVLCVYNECTIIVQCVYCECTVCVQSVCNSLMDVAVNVCVHSTLQIVNSSCTLC